ncbi:PREDICTED: uncharacterized protein LOC105562332 [Vollenhovia emeryi]|uniref:uncharacterized protein LOC105562332 n=1 Tax=Vollenhovia emeryi TaxID=411798 RepID=UPI0005F4F4B5|nr:PREDICTED: uncharacterized protein LOC105562332 [Vollenhovia emeryi]
MESETSNQSYENCNDFFYATVCHVCKRFGGNVRLKRCGGCKMIFYCGLRHQKYHRQQHRSLCNAVRDVLTSYEYNIEQPDATSMESDQKKIMLIELVETELGRSLEKYEREMFEFSRKCAICQELDDTLLKDCRKCAASYCKYHIDSIQHNDICAPLGLCFRSELLYGKTKDLEMHDLQQGCTFTKTFQDMKHFIKTYANLQNPLEYDIMEAIYSQYLTRPLTLFHATRLLEYVPKSKNLVIHVVGANIREEVTCSAWQILLDFMDIESLMIVMIGPELHPLVSPVSLKSGRKECLFKFYKELYENYVRGQSFVKPDLIVGFNTVIHQPIELGFHSKILTSFIELFMEQNCPLILTGYTLSQVKCEANRIDIRNRTIDYRFIARNPFSCLKPFRTSCPYNVFYENQYILAYRSSSVTNCKRNISNRHKLKSMSNMARKM